MRLLARAATQEVISEAIRTLRSTPPLDRVPEAAKRLVSRVEVLTEMLVGFFALRSIFRRKR
jgi:hypothetical protein